MTGKSTGSAWGQVVRNSASHDVRALLDRQIPESIRIQLAQLPDYEAAKHAGLHQCTTLREMFAAPTATGKQMTAAVTLYGKRLMGYVDAVVHQAALQDSAFQGHDASKLLHSFRVEQQTSIAIR